MISPSRFASWISAVVWFVAGASATSSLAQTSTAAGSPRPRPWMFVTAEPHAGLRSVPDVRRAIRVGHGRVLWEALLDKVRRESAEPPLASDGRRGLSLVAHAANRIMDAALVALVLDDRRFAEASLRQIEALFEPAFWPEWGDESHLMSGLKVSLRHGQLVMPIALAYDWLHGLLTPDELRRIVEGLERCAFQRYQQGVAAREPWSERRSNWMTTVVGGFAIAGMALGDDYAGSAWLIDFARPRMESYLSVLGPEGEFNETVQYAGSMAHVVRYFTAVRYASGGRDNPFARHPLGQFYRWYAHMTFPPGRVAGFGDPSPDMPPVVVPVAAVASAENDPLLQWLYLAYCDKMAETHRQRALELLYFDADLPSCVPDGHWPLGRAYHGHARLISSRSSWEPHSTTSVVYAKAAREPIHSHADWGQLCLDGYGDRLIVDLKASYPRGNKERYYDYQQWGHNVFVFGRNDTGGVSLTQTGRQGTIARAEFDPNRGGAWAIDLTNVYDGAQSVMRHVVHLLPRIVVVVDDARLKQEQPISLRWQVAEAAEPTAAGAFRLETGRATLAARMVRLDGAATFRSGRHRYEAPFNRDSVGAELQQKNEPYIELEATADRCRVLSLFCVLGPEARDVEWRETTGGWQIPTPEGDVTVSVASALTVRRSGGAMWQLPLGAPER